MREAFARISFSREQNECLWLPARFNGNDKRSISASSSSQGRSETCQQTSIFDCIHSESNFHL